MDLRRVSSIEDKAILYRGSPIRDAEISPYRPFEIYTWEELNDDEERMLIFSSDAHLEHLLNAYLKISRAEGGLSPPTKRRRDDDLDERMERMISRYQQYKEEGNILTYLRSIGNNIAGHLVVN